MQSIFILTSKSLSLELRNFESYQIVENALVIKLTVYVV